MNWDSLKGSLKIFSGRCSCLLKWLLLPLVLFTVISTCLVIVLLNSEPMKQLKGCQNQLANKTLLLEKYMAKLAEAQSSLRNCQNQSARQVENILELENRVKELEQINRNFSIKQELLEGEVQKWQEQSDQCETNMAKTNNQLKRTKEDLKWCQQDRDACRTQQSNGQANIAHGSYIVLIALSAVSLQLLYS
ncbi:uncharacterized protein LOC144479636 [Mustelus asterias]